MPDQGQVENRLPTSVVAACGEHYVASYLSALGLVVGMPRGGSSRFDLLVTNVNAGPAVRIQVKTGRYPTRRNKIEGEIYLWRTSEKVLEWPDKNLWFAYVNLDGWPVVGKTPEVFFVPSKVVLRCIQECLDDKEEPWFWMYATDKKEYNDASKFRGSTGLRPLLSALDA